MSSGNVTHSGPPERRLEKPLIALDAALDGEALIKAVFRLLKRAVPCDFVIGCVRFVPEEGGEVTCRVIDSRGRKYAPDVLHNVWLPNHPGVPILKANPGIKFITSRDSLPPEEILRQTRYYREVMQVAGFRHAVAMFFWDDPPQVPEASFGPHRAEGRPDFDEAELALLDRLYGRIDAALRRVRAIENERAIRQQLHAVLRGMERAVCLLDWELNVTESNPAAREIAARWNAQNPLLKPPLFALPPLLRDACAQLKERWLESVRRDPAPRMPDRLVISHPQARWLQATIAMQLHRATPLGKPGFVIKLQAGEMSPTNGCNGHDLAGLSQRERRLVRLVCDGKSNKEIADVTGRAVGSVKNSLHRIFRQLGVQSRSALIVSAAGEGSSGAKRATRAHPRSPDLLRAAVAAPLSRDHIPVLHGA